MQETRFWGAAHVYPNMEQKAVENLRRQDYNSFCPFFLTRIAGSSRFRPQTLFPGYVFVEIDAERPWGPINSTIGVIRLLASSAGVAYHVPRKFIDDLSRVLVRNPDNPNHRHLIDKGACVRLRNGAWSNQTAIVKWSSEERLGLFFSLFGREVEVEVSMKDVEVV